MTRNGVTYESFRLISGLAHRYTWRMKYWTWVEFNFQGDQEVSLEVLMACAKKHLDDAKRYAVDPILNDFRNALAEAGGHFAVYPFDIDLMVRAMANSFPDLTIEFRAVGEEFHDVWLRRYRGTQLLITHGPFEVVSDE